MPAAFLLTLTTLCQTTPVEEPLSWDAQVDAIMTAVNDLKSPNNSDIPSSPHRFETLLRSHPRSHVQIFVETDGKQVLTTDLYYGKGELHIIQHTSGWHLVTRGTEGYEWKVGRKTGQLIQTTPKDLIEYVAYLTDPAGFCSHVLKRYHHSPELFEPAKKTKDGLTELRMKKPEHGMRALQVDPEKFWYGGLEFENDEKVTKIRYTKPKAIDKFPPSILKRLDSVTFRKSPSKLSRHLSYL